MQDLIITNQGQELIAKMIAGTSTASFTKIQTSDYDYSTETLKNLTFLYDVKQEALISAVTRTDTTMVEVVAAVNNSDLTAGYYVKALGLFAADIEGNEILYAVSIETENPDYMPAFGGKTISGITYKMNTKVDISSQVTLEISPAAVPTMEQVNNLTVAIRTHAEATIYGEEGVHGMRYFNDKLQVQDDKGEWVDIETGNNSDNVSEEIHVHNADPQAHSPLRDAINSLKDKVRAIEVANGAEVNANPFVMIFSSLDGISASDGIWLSEQGRLEF